MTTTSTEQYDLIALGGDMAGLPLAQKTALKGRKTALVEKELLGGACLSRGCIPTKTKIHAAKMLHHVRRAAEFGIVVGKPAADFRAIVQRNDEVVKPIRDGAYRAAGKIKNLHLIAGNVRFEGPGRLADVDFLTNRSALETPS